MKKYDISSRSRSLLEGEAEKCIDCKKCMAGCPMLDKFCESPKGLLESLEKEGDFIKELPYSCMLCGYCEEACPVDVSFNDVFFNLRKDIEKACGGKLPKELNLGGVDLHQKLSFSRLFAKKLKKNEDTVFFPGCSLIGAKPGIVLELSRYLDKELDGCELMTYCCGKPTKYMGKEQMFESNIARIQSELDISGTETLIVGCLNCYKTLDESLESIEVVSLWTLLDSLDTVKSFGLDFSSSGISPTIHDPCPTRRDGEIHDAIRSMLSEMGIIYYEMDQNKKETLCCGAGAMVGVSQKELAERHMARRCSESKSEYIVTYCQECTESFMKQGMKAIHMLDLIFGNTEDLVFEESKLLRKWKNRFSVGNLRR